MKITKKQLFLEIIDSYKLGGSILACGNGGSATQANHLVEELVGRYKKDRRAALRNAKIRLSNIKLDEIVQVMRGKSKWIKH